MVILNVTNLSIEEISKINRVVVDEISFSLKKGEVLEYSKIYYNQKKYRFKFIAEGN